MHARRNAACLLLALAALAAPCFGQTYEFTVDPAASALDATFSGSATFAGELIGNYDQVANPGGTRTLDFNIFGNRPPAPTNIPKSISGSGDSGAVAAASPAGTYTLSLDLAGGTVVLDALATDLLNGAAPAAPVNANISYTSFLTAAPNNSYPFLVPIPIALDEAVLSGLTLTQTAAAGGPLTSTGPDQYQFTLSVPAQLDGMLLFQGSPTTISQPQTLSVNGTVTLSGASAAATIAFAIDQSQSTTEPQPGPQDQPFDLPPLSGSGDPAHLLIDLTITGSTTMVTGTASLPAAGVAGCTADYNGDGELTVADFTAFRNAYLAGDLAADCTGDSALTVADFTCFRNAYLSGCP